VPAKLSSPYPDNWQWRLFIGRQVAERLGIKYVDREILHCRISLDESETDLSSRKSRSLHSGNE
jgi:hypothetical protein